MFKRYIGYIDYIYKTLWILTCYHVHCKCIIVNGIFVYLMYINRKVINLYLYCPQCMGSLWWQKSHLWLSYSLSSRIQFEVSHWKEKHEILAKENYWERKCDKQFGCAQITWFAPLLHEDLVIQSSARLQVYWQSSSASWTAAVQCCSCYPAAKPYRLGNLEQGNIYTVLACHGTLTDSLKLE